MQITLVRHLPTYWNELNLLQGRRDIDISPPSPELLQEVSKNKKFIKQREPFDYILSSTLKRTAQTAFYYGYQPEVEPLLDEYDFGPFEGKPKEHLMKKHGNDWIETPLKITFGEGISRLQERIMAFLDNYPSGSNLLLFSHGTWTRAFLSYCRYGHLNNMNKFTVRNNECLTLEVSGRSCKVNSGGFDLV